MDAPNEVVKARESLQATLPDTMYVGSGFGKDGWHIVVYTDDKDTSSIPKEFESYKVIVRGVPQAYNK